jgi:Tissue inhibitor of metalloproteinase
MVSYIGLLALVVLWADHAHACSCWDDNTVEASLRLADTVVRGTVVRRLETVHYQANYVVRVFRIFKGSNDKTIQPNDLVIVTTGNSDAMCGIRLSINETYVLSGYNTPLKRSVKNQLPPTTSITQALSVGLCEYNVKWSKIPSTDVKTLRSFRPCSTGRDCRGGTEYCDAGMCVDLEAPCRVEAICDEYPCDVAPICDNASKCVNNYCGGCNAIFMDSAATRVCNNW